MKALITAGGKGTRLRPITYTTNKHLIPIANKPMIFYAIDYIREVGITEIGINYNDSPEALQSVLGDGSAFGVSITYIHQPEPIGLANIIAVAKDFLGNEPFIFYLGDNILAGGIKEFVEAFNKNKPDAQLLLAEVPDPERFGVPEMQDGRVVKVEEKPKHPKSNLAVTGVYMYSPNVWGAIDGPDAIKPSERGEYEISDLHQWLIDHHFTVTAFNVTGWWKDTGKPNDLLAANRLILEKHYKFSQEGAVDEGSEIHGNLHLPKDSSVTNSTIRGPVTIGANTKIENSYIGPFTSIHDNCVIKDSEIENSIVLANTHIEQMKDRIDQSLIGKNVLLAKNARPPHTMQVILGDNSQIEMA